MRVGVQFTGTLAANQNQRSEEHTSELQSRQYLVCRLLLEKKELCEAGLLPGALTRNGHLHFSNRDQALRIERADTAWTQDYETGQRIVVPVKTGERCYVAA